MKFVKIGIISVPALIVACGAAPEEFDDGSGDHAEVQAVRQELCSQGYWQCSVSWGAQTTQRMIKGPTDFECAWYVPFHSAGPSWVDIVGGISRVCNDHSDSFFGPLSGEWQGCSSSNVTQVSNSARVIESVDQAWDRWPATWRNGVYYGDLSWLTRTDPMRNPFASIYDLDYCSNKQLINTIFWPNFPVTAQLIGGNPASPLQQPAAPATATWQLHGSTGLLCSDQDGVLADSGEFSGPKRPPVCSDLVVGGTFHCQYYPGYCSPDPDPYPGPDPDPGPDYPILL